MQSRPAGSPENTAACTAELFGRVDLHAYARRRQRIGRTAAGHVGGENAGPAEGAVDQAARGLAGDEFIVAGELAEAERDAIFFRVAVLEPGREQPRGRQRVDVARVGDAADIIDGVEPAIVDVEHGEMGARALPADQGPQIGIDVELKASFVTGAAVDAAGEHGEQLADIGEIDVDAGLLFQICCGRRPNRR